MSAGPSIPDLESIRCAHERIRPHIHRTPVMTSRELDARVNGQLFFKCENLQKAGAFKSRGACNAVLGLSDAEAARGVVTHSSGNHAGALARAAGLRSVPAYIVMPETSPRVKVAAVRAYGGQITFCAPNQQARERTAQRIRDETGAAMIHPYNDARIIAGQATCAVEFLEDCPDLQILMTPVGGGGLLSGTLLAAHALAPHVRVWAGEPRQVDDAWRSWKSGRIESNDGRRSVADGLLTTLGELTFPIIHAHVDDILRAEEHTILETQRLMMERMKLVVEPSSAVPLAALLDHQVDLQGRRVGIIISGGNIDLEALTRSPSDPA